MSLILSAYAGDVGEGSEEAWSLHLQEGEEQQDEDEDVEEDNLPDFLKTQYCGMESSD